MSNNENHMPLSYEQFMKDPYYTILRGSAIEAFAGDIPGIWHYTNFNALKGIVKNSSLWATDYRRLNDSREIKESYRFIKGAIQKLVSIDNHPKMNWLHEMMQHLDSYIFHEIELYYVTSFTVKPDSEVHWAEYAKSEEGLCIEFNPKEFENITVLGTDYPACLHKIIYRDSEKLNIIEKFYQNIKAQWLSDDRPGHATQYSITKAFGNFMFTCAGSFKDDTWEKEQEYRMYFRGDAETLGVKKFEQQGKTFYYSTASIPNIRSAILKVRVKSGVNNSFDKIKEFMKESGFHESIVEFAYSPD